MLKTLFVCILAIVGSAIGSQDDLVTDLPGLSFDVSFKHYSGYLNATGGRKLHYWFAESERSPKDDPLVLWLNGGPGCSSLAGFLTEQGPFRVSRNDSRTILLNEYRWNQVASVIFLESPAGVGFSYREGSSDLTTDDDQTALDNLEAMKHFFIKFPQFKENSFFVTGESYAGIYVPTLSVNILNKAPEINLQGFAIGNGYLDQQKLGDSLILFGYFHGLFGRSTWSHLIKSCCNSGHHTNISNVSLTKNNWLEPWAPNGCSFVNNPSKACSKAVEEASNIIRSNDINIYNLYKDCDVPQSIELNTIKSSRNAYSSREYHDKKLMIKTLHGHSVAPHVLAALKDSPPCIDDSYVGKWLNQKSVRAALHVPSKVQEWTMCSGAVEAVYSNTYKTMKPQITQLLKAGKRGLIYNGDVDMACNFLGDEWFVDDLGLELVNDYREWHLRGQVAGYVKHFDQLVYATVKGSGHMVPEDKPGAALALVVGFLE